MKQTTLSCRWFDERSQSLNLPRPWQSAQLEIRGIPTHYPWQSLQLYTGILAPHPTPLYLKQKTNKGLVLHADWAAAEPGFHHLRLYRNTGLQSLLLWQCAFFIEATPLTQELWLHILESTHKNAHLRFQTRTPVPLQSFHSPQKKPTENFSHAISEFSRLQWLVSPAAQLGESLKMLKPQYQQVLTPLYRTRKIAPPLLYRNLKALPLHTPVQQPQIRAPELASALHFLILVLYHRYQWLSYTLPQMSKDTATLSQALGQLSQNWQQLWSQWQRHPYHQSQPLWTHLSLSQLKRACYQRPQLKPWLNCAELLQSPLTPGRLTSTALYTGYIGFGYVYQHWSTQRLRQALTEQLQSVGWSLWQPQASLTHPYLGAHWQSPTGEQLVLREEQRYAPLTASNRETALYSISKGQQPDLSLLYFESRQHWQRQQPQKGLVFEVKFRQDPQGRPRKTDLDRLHAYRDAIYVQSSHSSDHRLFVGGALLYPGHVERYEPGLEALTCLPGQELRLNYLLSYLIDP